MKTLLKSTHCGLLYSQKHHLQMSQIYDHAEELHKQHTQCFLR